MKRNRKNTEIRLYNVIFPLWMIFVLSPLFWLIALIGNFLIDSVVILLSLPSVGVKEKSQRLEIWKKSIIRVFLIGFFSDFIGALTVTVLTFALDLWVFPLLTMFNPYTLPGLLVYAGPAILLAGLLIYWLNQRFAFRKCQDLLSPAQIHKLALWLAWITAPYFMLIPIL